MLLLELVNRVSVEDATVSNAEAETAEGAGGGKPRVGSRDKTAEEQLSGAQPAIKELNAALTGFLLGLGEDVEEKRLKLYVAFRRLKNFACVIPYRDKLLVMLKLDPDTVTLEEGFSRDVRTIGTWGTGDLELCLRSADDLEKAKPLIERSYGAS